MAVTLTLGGIRQGRVVRLARPRWCGRFRGAGRTAGQLVRLKRFRARSPRCTRRTAGSARTET